MQTTLFKPAAAVLTALLVGACASLFGPSSTEAVIASLDDFHSAEKAGDIEGILDAFSDSYSNSLGATKALLRGFFEPLIEQGVLQTMTISTADTEVEVDGDRATAAPVSYSTAAGTISYTYTLRRESDGRWRIVQSEQI